MLTQGILFAVLLVYFLALVFYVLSSRIAIINHIDEKFEELEKRNQEEKE